MASLDRKCVHLTNSFFRRTARCSKCLQWFHKSCENIPEDAYIMRKNSGIARYVHHPSKNSFEYVFWSVWLTFASNLWYISQNSTCYRSSQLEIWEKFINLKKCKRNCWKMVLKTCSLKVYSLSYRKEP